MTQEQKLGQLTVWFTDENRERVFRDVVRYRVDADGCKPILIIFRHGDIINTFIDNFSCIMSEGLTIDA